MAITIERAGTFPKVRVIATYSSYKAVEGEVTEVEDGRVRLSLPCNPRGLWFGFHEVEEVEGKAQKAPNALKHFAIRTSTKDGKVLYFSGRGNGAFWFSHNSSLATATLFKSRSSAQRKLNERKKMSPEGPVDWQAARDLWSRAEIVEVEVSFKEL